jgi:hypothetical protein
MTEVQKAEKLLQEAKEKEKLQYRTQELEQLKKDYEGKCIASHTFERHSKAAYMGANYYESFYIEKNEIWVIYWSVSISRYDTFYKPSKKAISYNRGINKKQLTGQNDYNAQYNLDSGYSYYKKNISYEKFMQLWECAEEAHLIIKNYFDGKIPEVKQELIRQGDHSSESVIEKCISDMNIELIDFKKYPEVHVVLEYKTLPLFDRNRWLPKLYAKPILEWEINRLKEEMKNPFSNYRSREYNQKQINIIQKFINEHL